MQHLFDLTILVNNSGTITEFNITSRKDQVTVPIVEPEKPTHDQTPDLSIEKLKRTNGRISGKNGAAEPLSMNPSSSSKLESLGIHQQTTYR